MVLETKELTAQIREDIESIYKQSQRCRDIIQNLLQFSRRREVRKESIQIVPLIETTVQLIRYDFASSSIDIVTNFSDSLPPVFGDSSQLQQVFLNLITNARQALEKKKPAKLTLEASHES